MCVFVCVHRFNLRINVQTGANDPLNIARRAKGILKFFIAVHICVCVYVLECVYFLGRQPWSCFIIALLFYILRLDDCENCPCKTHTVGRKRQLPRSQGNLLAKAGRRRKKEEANQQKRYDTSDGVMDYHLGL